MCVCVSKIFREKLMYYVNIESISLKIISFSIKIKENLES